MSGLPDIGALVAQVGYSRLGCARLEGRGRPPISGLPEFGSIECASRQQPTCDGSRRALRVFLTMRPMESERYPPFSASPSSLMCSTDTTRSSSAVSNTITPCVERPAMRISSTRVRMSWPRLVTSMS